MCLSRYATIPASFGTSALTSSVARRLVTEYARRAKGPVAASGGLAELTDRERQAVVMVGHGLSNEEIAAALHLSLATVRTHIGRAMRKLDVRSRAELVVFAYETGLVRPGWLR